MYLRQRLAQRWLPVRPPSRRHFLCLGGRGDPLARPEHLLAKRIAGRRDALVGSREDFLIGHGATTGIADHRHPTARQPPGGMCYVRRGMPSTTRTSGIDPPPWMAAPWDCDPPMCRLSVPDAVLLRACCSGDSVAIVDELPEIEAMIALGMDESVAVRHDDAAKQDMRACTETLHALASGDGEEWEDVDRRDMGYLVSRLLLLYFSSSVTFTKDGAVYLRNKLDRYWASPTPGLPGLPELDELNDLPDDATVALTLDNANRSWLADKMAGFPGDQERAEEAAAALRNVASLVAGIDTGRVSRPHGSVNLIKHGCSKARRLGATEHEVESALRMVR